ncbi:MAG: 3-oxoacyl-ACP reductase family protein [Bacillota bacterium]
MPRIFNLDGKVALITGGATGIGRALAVEFARHGCSVIINYNESCAEAKETLKEVMAFKTRALICQADVTQESQVKKMVEETIAFAGKIDILVNNAGTMVERRKIVDFDLDLWRKVMDINFTSVFLVSKYVAKAMIIQGYGKIINISSVAARTGGGPGAVAYASAKGAVHTFTKGLAKELAPYGILVNAIAPGVIMTRFHEQHSSKQVLENFRKNIPVGRIGDPQEIAGAALLLATNYGSYMTGEMIEVNGGMLMD